MHTRMHGAHLPGLMQKLLSWQVNSETDFVARTEEFRGLVTAVAEAALRTRADGGFCTAVPCTSIKQLCRAPCRPAQLGSTDDLRHQLRLGPSNAQRDPADDLLQMTNHVSAFETPACIGGCRRRNYPQHGTSSATAWADKPAMVKCIG